MKTIILIPAFCLLFHFSCTATLCKNAANKPQLLNVRQKVKQVPRMPKRRQQKTRPVVGCKDKNAILKYDDNNQLPNQRQQDSYVGDFPIRPRKPE